MGSRTGERRVRPTKISVLAYDGCLAAELFGFSDVLLVANRIAARLAASPEPVFAVSIVGCTGRSISAAGGVRIGVQRWRGGADMLVVPGFDIPDRDGLGPLLRSRQREVGAISTAFRRGVPVTSLCVGAFLLGEAGLLDRRRVTTAWAFAEDLAQRYRGARVESDHIMIEDGGVTTSAAFTAAYDVAMHLVRRRAGDAISRATARMLLVAGTRETQAPYVDRDPAQRPRGGFAESVQHWLRERLQQPYDLASLATAFHVSPRTLLRRFKAETGQSPLTFLRTARIERAKVLLTSTSCGLAEIMDRVGYGDLSTFRRLFAATVRMSPGMYRRQFVERSRSPANG
jgi:transcriptional regulator GlxA family with amidase domain